MTKDMDEDTKQIFLVVIENAIVVNDRTGNESCLYCSWAQPLVPDAEVTRLLQASPEEAAAWWAGVKATSFHDEDCIVPNLRTRLGLPNPRAVYPD